MRSPGESGLKLNRNTNTMGDVWYRVITEPSIKEYMRVYAGLLALATVFALCAKYSRANGSYACTHSLAHAWLHPPFSSPISHPHSLILSRRRRDFSIFAGNRTANAATRYTDRILLAENIERSRDIKLRKDGLEKF